MHTNPYSAGKMSGKKAKADAKVPLKKKGYVNTYVYSLLLIFPVSPALCIPLITRIIPWLCSNSDTPPLSLPPTPSCNHTQSRHHLLYPLTPPFHTMSSKPFLAIILSNTSPLLLIHYPFTNLTINTLLPMKSPLSSLLITLYPIQCILYIYRAFGPLYISTLQNT